MTTLTEYETRTEAALTLSPAERADRIAYWNEWHDDDGSEVYGLTEDLMCLCCGVDYSGLERDLLADPQVGQITPSIQAMLDRYNGTKEGA